jgi:beta-xylosidase
VKYLRTGVSWADWFRENSEVWFDRQMSAVEEFHTTMTLCFTPEHLGVVPHYTSPAKDPKKFGEFARWAVGRYAPMGRTSGVSASKGKEQSAEGVPVGASE